MIALSFFVMMSSFALLQELQGLDPAGSVPGQNPPGGTPVLFAETVVTAGCRLHSAPVFTPDLREMYWAPLGGEGCQGKSDEILFSVWINGAWAEPEVISFSSLFWDSDDPAMSPDGRRIYFTTHRPSGLLSFDFDEKVMYVEREGDRWSSARTVGSAVNSIFRHWQVSVTQTYDLFFVAEKNVDEPGIFVSRNVDGIYQVPERLPDQINAGTSYHPYIAPDESFLIFVRTTAERGDDLFISFRESDGRWTEAENLGDRINSPYHDYCPSLTPDGKYLFFLSGRGGGGVYWVDAGFIHEVRKRGKGSVP